MVKGLHIPKVGKRTENEWRSYGVEGWRSYGVEEKNGKTLKDSAHFISGPFTLQPLPEEPWSWQSYRRAWRIA
jgi:hypothetical protein